MPIVYKRTYTDTVLGRWLQSKKEGEIVEKEGERRGKSACMLMCVCLCVLTQREKDTYLQEAISALRQEMTRLVPSICQQVKH